ncbi:protein-tyrosine phosphatase-like protein [Lyophyllum atratum]|nr:protein-tyrosine phosphatase-like protein [Lyophyllum atratum]
MNDLEPLDPAYVSEVLSRPPFVTIDGVINVRDLGSYPSESSPDKMTRPRFLYRSAELSSITKEGEQQLKALGIAKVFDLRSDTEIQKYDSPQPEIDGVEIIRVPVFQTEDYSPEMMAKRYQLYASGKTEAFMELYSQILDHAGPSFGAIFRHIRDNPTVGCLFHCTAGKDRTGLIAALLLKLAGVDTAAIAEDYALTRVGREPAREKIMARLSKEPLFASNNEAALNMFTCRHETMTAFLALLDDKYGGAEAYLHHYLNLPDDDVRVIRNNILVSGISRL